MLTKLKNINNSKRDQVKIVWSKIKMEILLNLKKQEEILSLQCIFRNI